LPLHRFSFPVYFRIYSNKLRPEFYVTFQTAQVFEFEVTWLKKPFFSTLTYICFPHRLKSAFRLSLANYEIKNQIFACFKQTCYDYANFCFKLSPNLPIIFTEENAFESFFVPIVRTNVRLTLAFGETFTDDDAFLQHEAKSLLEQLKRERAERRRLLLKFYEKMRQLKLGSPT
jgi:hypothetical protein